jgi:diacylglycerol kinase (CTP)
MYARIYTLPLYSTVQYKREKEQNDDDTEMTFSLSLPSPPVVAVVAFAAAVVLQILFTYIKHSDESRRRFQHVVTGQFLVLISYVLPIRYCHALLWTGLIGIIYVRVYHDDWYRRVFGKLLRPYELNYGTLPGAFYFLLGTALVAGLFPINVARYSVLCLSYADPMAAWMGTTLFPSYKIHASATISGCLACFLTSHLVGQIMLSSHTTATLIVGAIVCTIVEALPVGNDNLTIPLATSAAVQWAMSFE